ncbi:tRNA-splicing ligase RtcB (3'-phosphate/5'-hydroxy nucleic acid ligase) [Enteropsectra breve]|nr:tRNA-splicing ligase RtcB (3'-phosphate/5'-hydroxy nucleic acid ligase) [Enteropsectra breve]
MEIKQFEDHIEVNGAKIYVDAELRQPLLDNSNEKKDRNALLQFIDAISIPGGIGSVGMPDMHAGSTFPIGTVAAVDINHPEACICPEGVGSDINCGVRFLRTNLMFSEISGRMEELADLLYAAVPSGVGIGNTPSDPHKNTSENVLCYEHDTPELDSKQFNIDLSLINGVLEKGLTHLYENGIIPYDDLKYTESNGSLEGNSKIVYQCAKGKGLSQLGTLGSGNHYLEVQVVDEIFAGAAAEKLNLKVGQVVISIHTGSRGLGHNTCESFMKEVRGNIAGKNKLEYIPYFSEQGQKYKQLMFAASNFAFANRAIITQRVRKAFRKIFPECRIDNVYDVCHNIAKIEKHSVNGDEKNVLVHRKGASRALPPLHPELPAEYALIGQPVLVGGSMGTCSYLLVGGENSSEAFNSTCHGAGRLKGRCEARRIFKYGDVTKDLKAKGIVFRCGSEMGCVEESDQCYKDVNSVVGHSDKLKLTKRVVKVLPKIVIKG